VYIWDEFEYNRSDALTFARRALAAVEAFVNGMLDAFEDGKREIDPGDWASIERQGEHHRCCAKRPSLGRGRRRVAAVA
jgi:hypothetical protein